MKSSRPMTVVMAGLLGVATLAGCGDDDGGVSISDPWARPTAPDVADGAFYLTIANDMEAQQLLSASSDRCSSTELHLSSMSDDGVMSMTRAGAEDLKVPNSGEMVLEPGGLHIMCIGVGDPLEEGEEIPVTLEFSKSGSVDATVIVENR